MDDYIDDCVYGRENENDDIDSDTNSIDGNINIYDNVDELSEEQEEGYDKLPSVYKTNLEHISKISTNVVTNDIKAGSYSNQDFIGVSRVGGNTTPRNFIDMRKEKINFKEDVDDDNLDIDVDQMNEDTTDDENYKTSLGHDILHDIFQIFSWFGISKERSSRLFGSMVVQTKYEQCLTDEDEEQIIGRNKTNGNSTLYHTKQKLKSENDLESKASLSSSSDYILSYSLNLKKMRKYYVLLLLTCINLVAQWQRHILYYLVSVIVPECRSVCGGESVPIISLCSSCEYYSSTFTDEELTGCQSCFECRQEYNEVYSNLSDSACISLTEYGLLAGLAFTVVYGVMGLFSGHLVDKALHRKKFTVLHVTMLLIWSLAIYTSGLASSFGVLMFCRIILGVCQAFNAPCSYTLLASYFTNFKERTWALTIYSMGTYIGISAASFSMIGSLSVGYKDTLFLSGSIGIFLGLIYMATFDGSEKPMSNHEYIFKMRQHEKNQKQLDDALNSQKKEVIPYGENQENPAQLALKEKENEETRKQTNNIKSNSEKSKNQNKNKGKKIKQFREPNMTDNNSNNNNIESSFTNEDNVMRITETNNDPDFFFTNVFLRTLEMEGKRSIYPQDMTISEALLKIIPKTDVLLVTLASALRSMVGLLLAAYLPIYYERAFTEYFMSYAVLNGFIYAIGGILSITIGSLLTRKIGQRFKFTLAIVPALGSFICVLPIMGIFLSNNFYFSVTCWFIQCFIGEIWLAPATAILQEALPANVHSFGVGLYLAICTIVSTTSPTIVGMYDPATSAVGIIIYRLCIASLIISGLAFMSLAHLQGGKFTIEELRSQWNGRAVTFHGTTDKTNIDVVDKQNDSFICNTKKYKTEESSSSGLRISSSSAFGGFNKLSTKQKALDTNSKMRISLPSNSKSISSTKDRIRECDI